MKILVVNAGSTSIKLSLMLADASSPRVLGAAAEPAGGAQSLADAFERAFARLPGDALREIAAVGHRVVQGGRFVDPVMIDDEVMREVEAAAQIAPLHNRAALAGVAAAARRVAGAPMVAVFDTGFHASMPAVAAHYALPEDVAARYGIRRYGYHGIAHESMVERYAQLSGRPQAGVSLLTLQLGGGCSIAAIAGGRSVDTSMGFTPLEGLMMSTRSGQIDAAVVPYLQRVAGMSADEVDALLNERSGLLGVSGGSGDMSELLRREAGGDGRAHLAIEMFCYRVRGYIGAYLAAVPAAEAVVFGGGIGEHAPEVRLRICEPLERFGLRIDRAANARLAGGEGRFEAAGSAMSAWVVPPDEAGIIARETRRALEGRRTA